jgi:hypothetical protein
MTYGLFDQNERQSDFDTNGSDVSSSVRSLTILNYANYITSEHRRKVDNCDLD